jgi:hypothetical protein
MRIATNLRLRRREPATRTSKWTAERPDRRSLQTLQQALRKATEALTDELCHPGTPVPQWSEEEWAVARAVAAIHGVSPLLAGTSSWQGAQSWTRFLEAQAVHTARRFLRIQQLLQLVDGRSREAAIPVVPLKGAALHALGVYAPGERPMADLDLLVRAGHAARFADLLMGLGFHETDRTWKNLVFARHDDAEAAALGEHADNGIKIELHWRVAGALPRRLVDVSAIVFPESPHPGLNPYPSKAALLMHVLLHAAGDLVSRGLRLVQLHDIARLSAVMSAADWEELSLQGVLTADRSLWWAFPPLALANRYYACVPDQVLRQTAADCHWALRQVYRRRTLAEASMSYLWISALPGIEWARSLGAMLEYAAARVIPGRELLERHQALAKAHPMIYSGSWWQLSHGERIVRWILSRQARHETLQPVRAALLGARR